MERLIAFLLDNFFVVIVIIGFLLSMFGKLGKPGTGRMPDFGGGGQPPNRGATRPARPIPGPEQPTRPASDPQRQASRPVSPVPGAAQPGRPVSAPPQPQAREARPLGERPAWPAQSEEPVRRMRPAEAGTAYAAMTAEAPGEGEWGGEGGDSGRHSKLTRTPSVKPRTASLPSASPALSSIHDALENADVNELRKGLIWAEVLGPPRAKRPFVRGRNG